MARLVWDQVGERTYRTGVDRGVLYGYKAGEYTDGTAWNGLTNVTKTPSGAEPTDMWADNIKYLTLRGAEQLGLTIECYTYPDVWAVYNGEAEVADGVTIGQQNRATFGFAYRNLIGNDTEGTAHGYELNLIYGCTSSPSEQANATINDSPEAATFSYEISTTSVPVSGTSKDGQELKPTASVVIDSRRVDAEALKKLEDILYGSAEGEDTPRLPLPDEIATIFAAG